MKSLLALSVLLGCWCVARGSLESHDDHGAADTFATVLRYGDVHQLEYGDRRLVDYINSLNTTWTAGTNRRLLRLSPSVRRGLMGARPPMYPLSAAADVHSHQLLGGERVPTSFDARRQWGAQCPNLYEVRDQSSCGSCWAFGAVEAMSDRVCIASQGRVRVHLSADDLLSCCRSCGYGCDGGEPMRAWQYWVSEGIVTGSNYTARQGCKPYPFEPCEHHSNRTHFKPCHHDLYPTPQCEKSCQRGYSKQYEQDKFYGRKAYRVPYNVQMIQAEIMAHGPVEVAFDVYEDFLAYKSGVYQHHAGKIDGGHAVKMIGWGVEKSVPYWLVANSWNSDWGDGGFFKILRGANECGIESQAVAGLPRLDNRTTHGGGRTHQRQHYRRAGGRRSGRH